MSKHVHIIEVTTGQQNFSSKEELNTFINSFETVYPEQYDVILTKIQNMKVEGSMLTNELKLNSSNLFIGSKIFTTIEKATEYHDWITQGNGQAAVSYIFSRLEWSINNVSFLEISEERWNEIQQEISATQ